MFPLIYFNPNKKLDNFECSRIRKSLKNSLEINNESYATSILSTQYDIAHFIKVADFAHYSVDLRKGVKTVISCLSSEEDINGRLLFKNKKGEYCLEGSDVEILNKIDCVIVPSLKAKEFLISQGVKTRIEVILIPITSVKFEFKDPILKNLIFSYLQLQNDINYMVSSIYIEDYDAFSRISEISKSFPRIKFIVLTHIKVLSNFNLRLRNVLKNKNSNLLFITPLNEELYLSLIYNANAFLNVSSSYGNDQEMIDAMAAKTQIFSLNCSAFSDIAIDKETCYLYNNLDSLIEGIKEFSNGLIEPTTLKAYEFSKEANIQNCSQKLIKIYKELLEE